MATFPLPPLIAEASMPYSVACVVVVARFEVESAQIVMSGGKVGIEPGGFGKLLETVGAVELIDQGNPQI